MDSESEGDIVDLMDSLEDSEDRINRWMLGGSGETVSQESLDGEATEPDQSRLTGVQLSRATEA